MQLDWDVINADVLMQMDFDQLISTAGSRECHEYGAVLSILERKEIDATRLECLRFVGQLVMMMLRAGRTEAPFEPMFVINNQRSALPEDFPKDKLIELLPWAKSLSDNELKARVLDVLWMRARDYFAALEAVDSYIASALFLEKPDDWPPCYERLERALRLASTLGKGAVAVKDKVLAVCAEMLRRHGGRDPLYLSLRLIRLLLEFKYGAPTEYSEYALEAASLSEQKGDFYRAKDYYLLSSDCFRISGNKEQAGFAQRQAAECLVKEAASALGQPGRGAVVAASLLSDAVEAMRQAPEGKLRASEIHDQLLALQPEAIKELRPVSTTTNIDELHCQAIAAVEGKSLGDAIYALCSISRAPSIEELKDQVRNEAKVAILSSMISTEVLNSRGRVVATVPALEFGAEGVEHDGLRWRMFKCAEAQRSLTVDGILNPIREEIFYTHRPDREDIAMLIRFCPWIAPGHEDSVLRAILAGFEGDFIVVAHLVPPQLEAMIRFVVDSRGGATTMLEPGGAQPERPLSALLDTSEVQQAFGPDAVFELRDLLIDPLGANLRNEIAHGLKTDAELFSYEVLYAWWLLLRFCVLTSKLIERQIN